MDTSQNAKQRPKHELPFVVPLMLGALCVLAAWRVYTWLYPSADTNLIAIAKEAGTPPQDLIDLRRIMRTAEAGAAVSTRDWNRFTELSHSRSAVVRHDAMAVASSFHDPDQRNGAVWYLRNGINDPSPPVEAAALIGMAQFRVPGWKEEAAKRLHHSDEIVRVSAQAVLEKYGGSHDRPNTPQGVHPH